MWRNFGWTAILATWTIFLILNSGLAGERIFNNPRISNEHTSYKVQRAMSRAFDGKTTDRFALQRIKEDFKSNDRSSVRAKAVSPKCKNTENSDLRLSDCEKSNAVMSNAVTAPKHFKDSDGKNVRSTTGRTVTKNARLSKLITVKKLWNTRNYRKFGSNAGVSVSPKLKAEIRHKKLTTYVFSSERKRVIRRDIREEFDRKKGEWWKRREERRRIDNKYRPITFRFFDEFPKRSPSEKNDPDVGKMQNLDTSRQFETMENTEFRKVDVMRERNKNEGDSQSLESTRNGASNKLTYAKNESQTLKITLPNYLNLKADQNRENVEAIMSVTDSAIAEDSTYDRSANVAWTTLIADFEISNANGEVVDDENAISSYHFPKDEDPRSYKPLDEFPTIIAYKLRGYSERGFKVKYSDVREDRKENGNNVNSFTFHVGNPRDIHLSGTKISFAKRSLPRKEEHALARDMFGSRRAYRFSSNNIQGETTNSETEENLSGSRPRRRDAERMITDVDYATRDTTRAERDPLSSLSTGSIDETKLDTYTERISVTREKNPMHVQHVELDGDCERSRTTDFEAEVRGAFRTSLRNVSDLSSTSKFGRDFSGRKNHNRVKYSTNFSAIDNTALIPVPVTRSDEKSRLDEGSAKTSTVSEFASSDVTNVGDDSEGVRKINELTQFTNTFTNKFKLENVRDKSTSQRGNRRGNRARQGSRIYSSNGGVHNSKYRRNKRHEVRDTLGNFAPTGLGSETWKTLDATPATTTANLLIKFNASTFVAATQPNNADQTSSGTRKLLTTTETLPFSLYHTQNTWRSSPLIESGDHERHTRAPVGTDFGDLNSSKISPLNAPKTLNASSRETTLPISQVMLERSTAIADVDNFVTPDPPNGNVFDLADKKVFTMSSIEAINSHEEHEAEHGSMSTIDPVSQRSLASRDVLANDSSTTDDVLLEQWPVKHSAVVEGDLVLGGLMMVHEREDNITCGPVMPQGGVQALEAMLYTLDTINDRGIVPGVKIGAHILDDCDKDTYGLEMAVDFIKGSISNIDGAEYHCNKTAVRKVISGVVGAASSVTSIQVANLLRLFKIPQVSFFSTSPELSNKQRFEYFTRTIPSDHYQVKAMVDIVKAMNWSYVSIIYEESNYGIKAFEELEELLGKNNICIAVKEKLVKDSGVAEESVYNNIVWKLLTKPRAKGCIIFGSDQEVAELMRAVRRCNATGTFSWIGSDGWSARRLVSDGNEPEVEGTLSVQPQANPVKGFEEYFLNLTVDNNRRNPWFVEFWEDHFKCRYPDSTTTPYNKKYSNACTKKERLTKNDTIFEDQLQFVSDAVMAFAYAFRDMHRDLCYGKPGLCDAMKPTKGTKLLQYLRKVDFEGLSGDKFRFDKNGDGPARYNIKHFKQTTEGKYEWVCVGKYLEGELRLNTSEIQFKLGHPQTPESVCSLPCELGQAKKYVEGERCCWHCFNCTQYQIRHPKDETQCIQCRLGTLPDETHSTCRDVPEEFLRPESGWAIGAMAFSATGILVTSFVCGVFLRHNDTPVVRASGRELSYVLLSGILLCYLVTFTLVLKPTDIVCGLQRFAAGLCFTVVYAALLTKTNRISRIFTAGSARRPSFISPRSQLIICAGLIFVQILINVIWMLVDPARAMHHHPRVEDNLLVCKNYIDVSYMIAFAYPTILIIVCTIYAVLTRKIPESFNESKHIGLTMYTTCVIWCAFVPLYYGTGNNVALRITSMSVTISLSASVTVVCLFSPKLYIILIRPERNVRPTVRGGRPNLTKSSTISATKASSMAGPVTATTVLTAATCDQNKAIKKHIATTIDCSTQSECYELELKDPKIADAARTSRSTQTSDNERESVSPIVVNNQESPDVIASTSNKESKNSATTKRFNSNRRIGNGSLSQSDVSL